VVDALDGVGDPLAREAYTQRAAEVSGMRVEALEAALEPVHP
jgi:hypothetical protein